jgi:hypothetical protein
MPMSEPMASRVLYPHPDIARISLELALVDPELARRVRGRVPRKVPGLRPPLPSLRVVAPPAETRPGAPAD